MSLERQIFVVIVCYLLSFLFIRWFLWGVKDYQLNTSAQKKRKKGQTLKEWFLYSRYREEIPKILIILYLIILLVHPTILIACIVLHFMGMLHGIGSILAIGVSLFDAGWLLIYLLLFWTPGREIPYERWIKKKRSNKKK